MAKNKPSFQMLPDDVLSKNVTDNANVTQVTNFADDTDVTFDTLNKSVTEESNNQSVQPVTPEIPAPIIEQASNVTQPINVTSAPQVQYPVQEAVPAKTRVYVNIKTDNYNWVKRETGATGETLQNFFDSLIEEYRATHKPHFTD